MKIAAPPRIDNGSVYDRAGDGFPAPFRHLERRSGRVDVSPAASYNSASPEETAMNVADLAQALGVGEAGIRSEIDLLDAVSRGLPALAVDAVVHSGILSAEEADRLVIARRVLAARKARGLDLTREESDRLARIARVNAVALEQFGSAEKAGRWLRKPNRALGGRVPLELLLTGEGARVVEETIMRIAHGLFF
jgi:putative toxin-antitoxin system antitoxin component (TIGR02293 family)